MSVQRTPPGKGKSRNRPADESASSGEEEEQGRVPEASSTADPAGARGQNKEYEEEETSDIDPESEIFDGVELNEEDYPELRPVGADYISTTSICQGWTTYTFEQNRPFWGSP